MLKGDKNSVFTQNYIGLPLCSNKDKFFDEN